MRGRVLLMAVLLVLLIACAPPATPAPTTAPTRGAMLPTAVPAAEPAAEPTAVPTETPPPARPTPGPTAPPPHPSLGDMWVRPADGMVMVYVPAGEFIMGSERDDPEARPDEFPQHAVAVDGFWIDQVEVSNAQYEAFLNDHGNVGEGGTKMMEWRKGYCRIQPAGDGWEARPVAADHPVLMVTWYGAEEYCRWVGARLPTEAEWEYAARGPQGYIYPWGNDPPDCERANFGDCARATWPVGSRPAAASWCGALDMAGNVWEWVQDWHGPYPGGRQENPVGAPSGYFRVLRGGGWHSTRQRIRTTYRLHDTAPSAYNG